MVIINKILISALILCLVVLTGLMGYAYFECQKQLEEAQMQISQLSGGQNMNQETNSNQNEVQEPDLRGTIVGVGQQLVLLQPQEENSSVETVHFTEETVLKDMLFSRSSPESVEFKEEKELNFDDLKEGDDVIVFLSSSEQGESEKKVAFFKRVIVE